MPLLVDRTTIRQTLAAGVAAGLTDAAIGAQLGVAANTVCRWRQLFGLPRSAKFVAHFEARHGPGSLAQFVRRRQRGWSYARLGRHFGFSRQRAQQVWRLAQAARNPQQTRNTGGRRHAR